MNECQKSFDLKNYYRNFLVYVSLGQMNLSETVPETQKYTLISVKHSKFSCLSIIIYIFKVFFNIV